MNASLFAALALLVGLWASSASAQPPILVGASVPLDAKCIEASSNDENRIFVTGSANGLGEVRVKAFAVDAKGESIRSQALYALYQVVGDGQLGSGFYWACFGGKRVAGLTFDGSGVRVH